MAIQTSGNNTGGGRNTGGRKSSGEHRGFPPLRFLKQVKAQKPFLPIENPFPEIKEFRMGVYKIIEERDDYIICRGYDPNSKFPSSQYTPAAHKTIKVAKPSLLQRTVWENAAFVDIGDRRYTYVYSDTEYGVRTATWVPVDDTDGDETEEEQTIETAYFPDDVLVAVEIRATELVDGIDVESEVGGRLSWIDLNMSGRHWHVNNSVGVVIRFQILTVDCAICIATATVMSRPVGVSSVRDESAGVVDVFDFAGCFLNAPSQDLIGKQGFATYLDGGVGDCAVDPDVVNRWEILSLCCAEEDCP
jgi:hypothetical protein